MSVGIWIVKKTVVVAGTLIVKNTVKNMFPEHVTSLIGLRMYVTTVLRKSYAYVFLSWQGDTKKTRAVLKDLGTDTISDFIERTGQGYRVLLYRQLMKSYANVENKSSDLFNVIQKQNLVNCRTVEPGLVEGAEQGYVDSLFKQLSVGEDHVD